MANFSTPMQEFIAYSSVGDLKNLLKGGKDQFALKKELPFHYLASNTRHKRTDLFTEIIELLLDFRFDINALNEDGKPALHVAIFEYQNLPVAVPLMKNGGDFKGVSLEQMDELGKLGLSLATPMWLRRNSAPEMHRGGLQRILEIRLANPPGFALPYSNLEEVTWETLKPWMEPSGPQKSSPYWFVLENIETGEVIAANHYFSRHEGMFWAGVLKVGDKIYKHYETKEN